MKILETSLFGFDTSAYLNNDWEQLEVLWNKNIIYNWYEFTIIHLSWSFNFIKSKEEFSKKIGKHIKIGRVPKISIGIRIGLLGFNLMITIFKDWIDEN